MTREEALNKIGELVVYARAQGWDEGFTEAFETLSVEPCEDTISRQAVLNTLDKMDDALDEDRTVEIYKMLLTECVTVLPSVTPKQKTGHWILLDECCNSGYYCSECQKKVVKEGWSDTVKKIKFCPNCGADMRGAE